MLTTEKQNIVLAMHKNPDGDACGAAWAIKLALEKKYPNKKVYLFSDDPNVKFRYAPCFPENEIKFTSYDELPEDNELYILDHFEQDYSLVPNWKAEKFTHRKVIDHHWKLAETKQDKEDQYINTSAGSTCEIIFEYMKAHEEDLITPEVAASLYLGIKSDSCFLTADSRPEVIYMLNSLLKDYKSEAIVRKHQITGFNGYLSLWKGLGIPIFKSSLTGDIITLKLEYNSYIRVSKNNKVSCGRVVTFLQSIHKVNHVIYVYEYAPDMWNITFRTKRKGVIKNLQKVLNRQFLDWGFTIVGIAKKEQANSFIKLIKSTIKTFTEEYMGFK